MLVITFHMSLVENYSRVAFHTWKKMENDDAAGILSWSAQLSSYILNLILIQISSNVKLYVHNVLVAGNQKIKSDMSTNLAGQPIKPRHSWQLQMYGLLNLFISVILGHVKLHFELDLVLLHALCRRPTLATRECMWMH